MKYARANIERASTSSCALRELAVAHAFAAQKGIAMQKFFALLLAVGCVGTSAVVVRGSMLQPQGTAAQTANDAAFRDGLYLGRLAHAANRQMRAPVGRWSSEKDRASFVEGYQQGLSE